MNYSGVAEMAKGVLKKKITISFLVVILFILIHLFVPLSIPYNYDIESINSIKVYDKNITLELSKEAKKFFKNKLEDFN